MKKNEMKMKAVVLFGPNKYSVDNIPIPIPKEDEVLCKIHAVAICGSDPKFINGDMEGIWPPVYPFVIGHEWAGEVVKVGRKVKGVYEGQRVSGEAHLGCGFCSMCKSGKYNLCLNYGNEDKGHRHYGHNSTGSYAQYGIYGERSLTPIPNNVSYRQAAIVDAAGTSMHSIDLTGITTGGTVVIIGPGPIGLITAKIAKSLGASKVIVIGRGERLQIAKKIVADEIIDYEKENVTSKILSLTGNLGADEVFECSGANGTINQAINITKKGGSVGLMGIPNKDTSEKINSRKLILDQISLFGSRANPNVSEKILKMISSGNLYLDDLITHTFSIDKFPEALETFVKRKNGAFKVIVEPNK